MPTLRSAAALLAAATNIDSLTPIASAVGCTGAPSPLDAASRATLGIPDDCPRASVARGPDTLRALLVDVTAARPMREVVAQLARRLSARAPHLLWILIACREHTADIAIAAWTPGRSEPRVAALMVDRSRIADSDAETLCAVASAMEAIDVLTHARWVAVLGREAVTRRFYRTLERLVGVLADHAEGGAPPDARRDIALLYASRLLFLSFLEAKEWLDGDRSFLARRYDACLSARGGFQRRVLVPLFFGTLNTPIPHRAALARTLGRIPFLNGGLFARSSIERTHAHLQFRDQELGRFLSELLGRYRFTAREETSEWSEAAIDPEMLGRAFESLMAGHERRETGAFFTPHELVVRVTDEALTHALGVAPGELVPGPGASARISAGRADSTLARLSSLRLLDPACGSGAFLVHALERLAGLHAALGDLRPVAELRRATLTRSIFGVDINPTAVWLCQLRLWLSIVIESSARDPSQVAPLPNLDRHVRIGDALSGSDAGAVRVSGGGQIARLRTRYARAVGTRKRTLARALDRAERQASIATLDRRIAAMTDSRRDVLLSARSRDLFGGRATVGASTRAALDELRTDLKAARARRRTLVAGGALPFSFVTHFADVASAGGFDVIIGNPPWVRVHRIPAEMRASLRRDYASYRGAAWRDGAAGARAGIGFAGQVDLAALFIERSLAVAAPNGVVALLVPSKLWRSLAGGGIRRLLTDDHRLLGLEDWSDAPALFDAAVYPSLVVVRRGRAGSGVAPEELRLTVHASRIAVTWTSQVCELGLDDTAGAPWLTLPPPARKAFDALRSAGQALGTSHFGAPMLGVKCGCNGAFVVHTSDGNRVTSENGHALEMDRALLRPLVRGEHVTPWRVDGNGERLIWTHGPDGQPLDRLPAQAERWFRGWRRRLIARSDARHGSRWWSLFRTESAANDVARVVWADFGRSLRAAVLLPDDPAVPLNTCYAVRCADPRDAFALAAVLNSPLASAWLGGIAEPARGGYKRFLGWTLALLPLPARWDRVRDQLADVGQRALAGEPPGDADLHDIVTRAYGLRPPAVAALLDWAIR
ncbi:MAG TPA: N-6 DNA methylase [Gemmatimonadaceae bacterium]|nr:N-6 DNA methylase [Gemmatimonadaceae bacterium]